MSGDVQPRKRKEKRKKKEGSSLGAIHDQVSFQKFTKDYDEKKSFDLPDQGEKIHIQNEHGIGGNICVKIIFFCLLGLLVGAIGLIYLQYQGSTDVDLPSIEESRFAEYFTGWLDDGASDHEHESLENKVHEESGEHDEHDENYELEEHDDEEEEEEHNEDEDEDKKDGTEDQSPEVDEPGIISRILGIQEDGENDEEESVDEEFIKSNRNEINEEMVDSENDEEDENKYNMKSYKNKNRYGTYKNDDDNNGEDSNYDDDEDMSKEAEKENESGDNEEEAEEEDKDKDEGSLDEKDEDSGIDDEDEEEKEDDEEKYDASQADDDFINNKSKGKYAKYEDENDDAGEDEKEDEEEEDSDILENELNRKLNEKREEVISKEEDDNISAEQEFGDQEDSENLEKEDYTDDLGYDEIDESDEEAEDENKQKEESNEEDDLYATPEFTKNVALETEEDIDESKKSNNIEEKKKIEAEEILDDENNAKEGGVAVKLGVGIALIIVAHLVLVQKWKAKGNASCDESTPEKIEEIGKKKIVNLSSEAEKVISRRQTLVPENAFPRDKFNNEEFEGEELEEDEENENEEDEEEYSEEEEEVDEEEEEEKCKEGIINKQSEKCLLQEKPSRWEAGKELGEGEKEEYESDVEDESERDYEEEDEVEEEEEEGEYEEDEEVEQEEESDEEQEDNFEEDVEIENNSKIMKQQVREAEDTAPVPPPRTHKRGPQEMDEDTEKSAEFIKNEENHQNVAEEEETLQNSLPPEDSTSTEKQAENDDDWYFREEFNYADQHFENNPKASLKIYENILSKNSTSVRALIGLARVLDHIAEKEKSNIYLKRATNSYKNLLLEHGHLLQDDMFLKLAERCIERMRFGGYLKSAIEIHNAIISRFPNTPKYRNTLAVTYLMLNKIESARKLLNETLTKWPGNGFALVHYGFILKTTDNNMEEAVKKLTAGIQTKEEGVIDGMFFFHLGDALNRLGRPEEAMKWYDVGVKEGLFLSKYQRSLYNVNRLKGQPWWTKEETTYQIFFKRLEDNWREIRKEGLALLNSKGVNLFKEETENLKDTGDWRQLDLYFRGRQQSTCKLAPITCSLVSSFKPAAGCTRGQIKFSVMHPDTHVWPHCGPTNCRLRSHLGLIVPKYTYIRVAEEIRSWEEGKFIIFDDSFEHEVWHNGTGPRLVLIVDVWHPELTQQERQSLSPI